jgi:outer membrane protein assembly factor BamB
MGMNRRVALNSLSAPSPATDGKVVAFMFGTGVLVVFDVEGKELWRRDLTAEQGELTMKFAPSSSLLLHEGTLYVQALRRPEPYRKNAPKADPLPSFLMAIDPQTGKNRWFHERPTDAVQESHDSYVTPIPWRRAGRLEIVAIGGDSVTGHDAGDGRELWRWNFNPEKRKNWRVVPTPVVRGDTLFFVEPRGNALVALKPEGEGLQKSEPLWRLDQDAPDVCSLLLYNNSLYVLEGDRRVMSRIDPESGKVLWRGTLGDSSLFRSSPTAGDGKIYAINEQGRVFVLDAGDEFRALSEIEMGGKEVRASIVIANKRLFIRTNEALYCVGGEARK